MSFKVQLAAGRLTLKSPRWLLLVLFHNPFQIFLILVFVCFHFPVHWLFSKAFCFDLKLVRMCFEGTSSLCSKNRIVFRTRDFVVLKFQTCWKFTWWPNWVCRFLGRRLRIGFHTLQFCFSFLGNFWATAVQEFCIWIANFKFIVFYRRWVV